MSTRALFCVVAIVVAGSAAHARADVVYAWGYNNFGQLGDGTYTDRYVPTPVSGPGSGVTAVAAGAWFNFAIQNGALWAWGLDGNGQLGNGTFGGEHIVPVAVSGMTSGVTAVTGGTDHSLAIQNGAVWAWGFNGAGRLGNGTTNRSNVPVAVSTLTVGVTAIAGGDNHSLAIQNGAVWAWGGNEYGELGIGASGGTRTVPVAVSTLTVGVTAVAAGREHSLAIQNGAVWAWGWNNDGQLGDTTTTNRNTPVPVSGLTSGVTAVAAGSNHSLAIQNGTVWAWGANGLGQLGDGTTTRHLTPEQIDPADLTDIVAIAASQIDSYALAADGTLWAWGYSWRGELGDGTTTQHLSPEHIFAPDGYRFTSIDADSVGSHVVATLASVPEPASLVILALAAPLFLVRRQR